MGVPSFTFVAFALIVIAAFRLRNTPRWQQAVLLIANLTFIASFSERFGALLPYAGFLLLGALGIAARRSRARWTSLVFPALVLAMFVWLKRYLFVPKGLLLPTGYVVVGLSYVFFRVMHLVIDGWEALPRGVNGWVSYLNYTLNFTSLVSGPIQRYEEYRDGERSTKQLTLQDTWLGIERAIIGFFKVYIVSALLLTVRQSQIDALSTSDVATSVFHAAALTAVYPVFLYFNFSGYTDFVIGIARFVNIDLPENF